jgi:hypothetical protein
LVVTMTEVRSESRDEVEEELPAGLSQGQISRARRDDEVEDVIEVAAGPARMQHPAIPSSFICSTELVT